MAVCNWCHKDMLDPTVIGCEHNLLIQYPDGFALTSLPYENECFENDPKHRCHDCGVKIGQPHHPGCDMERCPRCCGQLIKCGCLNYSDDPLKMAEKLVKQGTHRYM